jgi:hypothetical protein
MNRVATPYQKPKIQAAILAGLVHFERLLLEGLVSGKSKPMTAARKKRVYRQALDDSLPTARRKCGSSF